MKFQYYFLFHLYTKFIYPLSALQVYYVTVPNKLIIFIYLYIIILLSYNIVNTFNCNTIKLIVYYLFNDTVDINKLFFKFILYNKLSQANYAQGKSSNDCFYISFFAIKHVFIKNLK